MMRLSEAAVAVNGKLAGDDRDFFAVSTDTRAIKPGDLFIALKGEKFDGTAFAGQAIELGAAGVMVNSDASTPALPCVRVDDTRIGLGKLAAHWRNRFGLPVIAITGSNGKTTVKEMTATILRAVTGNQALSNAALGGGIALIGTSAAAVIGVKSRNGSHGAALARCGICTCVAIV